MAVTLYSDLSQPQVVVVADHGMDTQDVQEGQAVADAPHQLVLDLTVIPVLTIVVTRIWEDEVFLDKDFQEDLELDLIAKTKTAIRPVVVAVQVAPVTVQKMINNRD
jgi:hypothetical protein